MNDTLSGSLQNGLAVFYLICALLNAGFALYFSRRKEPIPALVWSAVMLLFLLHSVAYLIHADWVLPTSIRAAGDAVFSGDRLATNTVLLAILFVTVLMIGTRFFFDRSVPLAFLKIGLLLLLVISLGVILEMRKWPILPGKQGATIYVVVSIVAFAALLVWRKFFVNPQVGLTILNLTLLLSGWAMTDSHFNGNDVMGKADNVPIAMLIYSVGFFTWFALYRAVQNDERIARGEPVLEKEGDEKVLVWPDLVYTELICMVIATIVLIIWSVLLKAPLEQPATTAKAPNPSKAPWYFLGLQEMLVYYDPWMAGVVLPTMIIVGLMAIPYIDFNQAGNGYFSFANRAFAVTTFMFGFLVLWVVLIVLGTFLRGPNWNFFGPFEYWDTHKVDPLNNVNLSELFWLKLLGRSMDGMSPLVREAPGLILVFLYLFVLPPLLARTIFHSFFVKMGFVRYMTLMVLLLFMVSLPLKMVLRWTINLKYIVYIPEIFFNI